MSTPAKRLSLVVLLVSMTVFWLNICVMLHNDDRVVGGLIHWVAIIGALLSWPPLVGAPFALIELPWSAPTKALWKTWVVLSIVCLIPPVTLMVYLAFALFW